MRRKALLIGNTSGLPGVKVDITRFSDFLGSKSGGAWSLSSGEIEVLVNKKKSDVLHRIDQMRRESFDYVIVLFSGHGGQVRQTVLEINEEGEKINETSLRCISDRQLNIYDCCRKYSTSTPKIASFNLSLTESLNRVRERYDNRIMQAIPQQVLLYSCSIGQGSYDTAEGGVYLTNLLAAARKINSATGFKLVGAAHQEAILPTHLRSLLCQQGPQDPDAILQKCLSDQQLIISMKEDVILG